MTMEGKWTSDLASLLRTHSPHNTVITCRGNDNTFGVYQHALANHFSQNPVVWKRNGKVFPNRIAFPLKFVVFEDSLCWGTHITVSDIPTAGYLHLFFINSASVEEYRTSVRHNVSEWFAKVSVKPDVQWLIVVDSTRSKEKKNRTALMEKLKSDFNRHSNRLIEVSESVEHGSFSSLVEAVQASLLSHLEIVTNTWESLLGTMRDQYKDDSWNIVEYCTSVTEFGRLFWSCGAFEHALTIYDDLDRFILQIVVELVEKSGTRPPQWLAGLQHGDVVTCPTLRRSMHQASIDQKKDYSLLGLRHFLLSQQILLCLYMYQSRLRSRGAAPSLRVDFAGLIVKYTQHALQTVLEHSTVLEVHTSPLRLACWSVLLVGEALHVCGLLADAASVESAAPALCQLYTDRFNAVLELSAVLDDPETGAFVVGWLKKSDIAEDCPLIDVLQNISTYAVQLQKVHDISSSFLTQCGRQRQAANIGWKLAKWLRSHGRLEAALPFHLRFVARLLDDGEQSQMVVDLVKDLIPSLQPQQDYQRLISYRLFVALNDISGSESSRYFNEWMSLLRTRKDMRLKSTDLSPQTPPLFHLRVVNFVDTVQLPQEQLSIDIEINNRLSVTISDYRLVVYLRELDESVMSRRKDPVFQLNYSARDGACRMLAPHRGHAFDRAAPSSPSATVLSFDYSGNNLAPGLHTVSVKSSVSLRGCYVLERAELLLYDDSFLIDFDQIESRRPVVVFVQSTPNKVWIDEGKDLLAGVVQSVGVFLEAGTSIDQSNLLVSSPDAVRMEFMAASGEWSSSLSIPIPLLAGGQRHRLSIPLCVTMDSSMTDSPAMRKVKLSFEWTGRTWTFELPFVALLILSSRTSILENKILYELEMARALAEEWTVVIESASLDIPSKEEGTPPNLAKLLNTEMVDLIPNIVSTLVWVLPVDGDVPIKHQLSIRYRVKPSKEPNTGDSCGFIDRLYDYQADIELKVPKVGYELCTQMLSQQPGAQLCRAGSPCDLVVSLRSLKQGVEMLYIVLDADAKLWTLNERAKVLQVKESGLGQMAFSVVPCAAGFLPYPSVSVYSCIVLAPRGEGGWSDDLVPGAPLVSFQRTAGRQIRVLAASQTDTARVDDRKQGTFKQKFVKLFD